MHPNGQIPAYEWAFGDVNPPVHAWAAWRVYKIDRRIRGVADREFLERVFHKLLLNFTWWVNRKDPDGRNVFQGGFLGLDNIGLFPLFAVETFDTEHADRLPGFRRRAQWFIDNNPELREHIAFKDKPGGGRRVMLSIVTTEQLPKVLRLMLDEEEFLSPHGVRSLSRYHKDHPYVIPVGGQEYRVGYEPAESTTGVFGGNSNWRGPVWFPVNFLIVESLQKYHHFFGDDLKAACPTGPGRLMSLWSVAA